jgi:hypothetical protein
VDLETLGRIAAIGCFITAIAIVLYLLFDGTARTIQSVRAKFPIHLRYALTLRTQLAIPLVPFVIDFGARTIILWNKVKWYQLPDLWTLLVTYAFFASD